MSDRLGPRRMRGPTRRRRGPTRRRRGLTRRVRGLTRRARSPRVALWLAAATALLCCCAGLVTASVLGAIGDSAAQQARLVTCGDLPAGADRAALASLDAEQRANGELIVEVGVSLATPPRAWVIAVATAMQESGLRNLPHLGAENDHDSLGLFQQRPSQGWGTPEQIMDPEYAATAFYERLLQVEGWRSLPLTVAADAVQRSAYPDAYAKHEPLAVAVVEATGGATGAAAFDADLRCAGRGEVTVAGWTRPAPGPVRSGFRTANRPDHYGVDIGAPRGAVVRAAADGVVTLVACNASRDGQPYSCDVDGGPSVAGCGWYVDVRHGDVVTRYCHLLTRPRVEVGDRLAAGDPIGLVGSSGHSSGPHLHFEVEVHTVTGADAGGGTLTRAQTDPAAFLARRGVVFECPGPAADCVPVHGDRVRTG